MCFVKTLWTICSLWNPRLPAQGSPKVTRTLRFEVSSRFREREPATACSRISFIRAMKPQNPRVRLLVLLAWPGFMRLQHHLQFSPGQASKTRRPKSWIHKVTKDAKWCCHGRYIFSSSNIKPSTSFLPSEPEILAFFVWTPHVNSI